MNELRGGKILQLILFTEKEITVQIVSDFALPKSCKMRQQTKLPMKRFAINTRLGVTAHCICGAFFHRTYPVTSGEDPFRF